jgi:DNA-binding CsgD family transcriptional regulator
MLLSIAEIVLSLWELPTVAEVIQRCTTEFMALGGVRFSYHLSPPYHSQTSDRVLIRSRGFAPEWAEMYGDPAFRMADPVTNHIMRKGTPLSWQEAIDQQTLTSEQQDFVRQFETFHAVDGVGIPLFGPNNIEGFCTVSVGHPIASGETQLISDFRRLALGGHTRIALIIGEQWQKRNSLSAREKIVLKGIAQGLSNKEIAREMQVTPTTVDTYVRRIFLKLGARDRTGASIRAISKGLIKL